MRLPAGVANICIITNHTTIVRQRIDVPVPRKRKGGGTALGADRVGQFFLLASRQGYTTDANPLVLQAHSKFLMQVYDAVNRHFNFDELKVLIIASPGFTKETVYSFLLEEAVVRSLPHLVGALEGD